MPHIERHGYTISEMQTLSKMLIKGYTTKETFRAYLVTGWFSFGAYLAFMMFNQQLGRIYLPELFYLVMLSLVMLVAFPLFSVLYNGFNAIDALARHDYPHALLSFGLTLGVLMAWYIIRYALYGRPRHFTVPVP